MRSVNVGVVTVAFLLISEMTGTVHAYLDPGTGSMAIQLVLGGLVGALTLVKLYWRRMTGFVRRRQGVNDRSLPE